MTLKEAIREVARKLDAANPKEVPSWDEPTEAAFLTRIHNEVTAVGGPPVTPAADEHLKYVRTKNLALASRDRASEAIHWVAQDPSPFAWGPWVQF